MLNYRRLALVVVALCVTAIPWATFAQGESVAVFVQAAAAVPGADLEYLFNYAMQRCSIVTGASVSTRGEIQLAQRQTNTYVGSSLTLSGLRSLAQTLDVDYVVIHRFVDWSDEISFRAERALLWTGFGTLLGGVVQAVLTPLGLVFGLERTATVCLFTTVFTDAGDITFTTSVVQEDCPILSLVTADPLEAAKKAIEVSTLQMAVAL